MEPAGAADGRRRCCLRPLRLLARDLGRHRRGGRPDDDVGVNADQGSAYAFRIAKPGRPTAKSPKRSIRGRTPTFRWRAAAGAAAYEVRIYKGKKLLKKQSAIVTTSWKCTKRLPRKVWLTWKVRARNRCRNAPAVRGPPAHSEPEPRHLRHRFDSGRRRVLADVSTFARRRQALRTLGRLRYGRPHVLMLAGLRIVPEHDSSDHCTPAGPSPRG